MHAATQRSGSFAVDQADLQNSERLAVFEIVGDQVRQIFRGEMVKIESTVDRDRYRLFL